jgi:NAD-dependent DNA ligase
MLSLQDAFDYDELKDFLERVYKDLGMPEDEVEFVCELKIDGSAVSQKLTILIKYLLKKMMIIIIIF